MSVALQGVRKTHPPRRKGDPVVALAGVDLEAADGELVVVVGPSGSGKTTLLRCIAGLEELDAGRVWVGGHDVTELPPGKRDVAMVFQEYALFPHVTARANIAFGLKARKVPQAELDERVERAAAMLSLRPEALDRRPQELSGGERQRIALGRAVVREPTVFLMDEPLSNLDAEMRAEMRAEMKALQRQIGTTMLYVTHDQVEAMTMGDRVVVLRDGAVEQIGPAMELYDRPTNVFVARFIGSPSMNVFPAELSDGIDAAWVGVRPDKIKMVAEGEGRVDAVVDGVEPIGHETIVRLSAGGRSLAVLVPVGAGLPPGSRVGLMFLDSAVHRFDAAGDAL